ncbi:MAG: biopolymer transporter ExbD [Betaproteobacteria bacterium]
MAFGGFSDDAGSKPMADINMIPLIDVMLVLLIIFIVTAPLLAHAIKIDLPQANTQSNPDKPEIVTLSVDGTGHLFWNDQALSDDQLAEQLAQAAARTPQPELHLRADRTTQYEKLAQVMAAAQRAGVSKMGFVTEPVHR